MYRQLYEIMERGRYYFSLPDNVEAFYAFVNLVINNRNDQNRPEDYTSRPKHFGPVKDFASTRNEVGERFLITYNVKDHKFLEMLNDQFCLMRTYYDQIEDAVEYPNSSKY